MRVVPYRQTDGQTDRQTDRQVDSRTDMTKLTVSLLNFWNVPNKRGGEGCSARREAVPARPSVKVIWKEGKVLGSEEGKVMGSGLFGGGCCALTDRFV
jgi:hypothetical protein